MLSKSVVRVFAYAVMALSLAASVLMSGGVYPEQWEWCALGISLGACLCVSAGAKQDQPTSDAWGLRIIGLLLAWMLFQLVPLHPWLVAFLSPKRWKAVTAARALNGYGMNAWLALSVAPAQTIERLLYVVPAMAAFVASREMARWWSGRAWITLAPVVVVAGLEGALGVMQFYSTRTAEQVSSVSGTYVNKNHFAGLLEMAFPLAVMWAIAVWRKGKRQFHQRTSAALKTSILLVGAACLLVGVILSLSRSGFLATLAAATLTAASALLSLRTGDEKRSRWRWAAAIAVPLVILAFFSTNQMAARLADLPSLGEVSSDGRTEIWRETARLVSAYKWTGCGLGAYEEGLFQFKKFAPMQTVDFAHNDYLQILAELGLPGAALVALLGVWILRRNLRFVSSSRKSRNWEVGVGLLGAFLAIGLHSLTDFNLYIPANALALAWLAGVAVSPELEEHRRDEH